LFLVSLRRALPSQRTFSIQRKPPFPALEEPSHSFINFSNSPPPYFTAETLDPLHKFLKFFFLSSWNSLLRVFSQRFSANSVPFPDFSFPGFAVVSCDLIFRYLKLLCDPLPGIFPQVGPRGFRSLNRRLPNKEFLRPKQSS